MRSLSALENFTRKNRTLLSSLVTSNQLHQIFVSTLQLLESEDNETTKLCLILVNRLL